MEPTTLTARSPEDLIALTPVALGFQPEESVVMLTFGAGACHGRIDLPATPADVDLVVGALLAPVLRHHLRRAALLVYSRAQPDRRLVVELLESFLDAGVDVVDLLLVDGRRWRRFSAEGEPGPGVPYDVAHHRFTAEAVLAGQVTWSSRRALAASLEPDRARVAVVKPLVDTLPAGVPGRQRSAERAWLLATMAASDPATPPDDATTARLLRDLRGPALWAPLLLAQTRDTADRLVALWTWVLRAAPPGWAAGPAVLLGFAAWLGGQGALAWCAVERCLVDRPDDEHARWLAELLVNAVPPSRWDDVVGDGVRDPA